MGEPTKTDAELLAEANELARLFYEATGYIRREGFRFDRATHPQEQLMWRYAAIAYEYLTGTEIDSLEDDAQ